VNKDIRIVEACVKVLGGSPNRRMLRANLEYLVDRLLVHPPRHIRDTFNAREGKRRER